MKLIILTFALLLVAVRAGDFPVYTKSCGSLPPLYSFYYESGPASQVEDIELPRGATWTAGPVSQGYLLFYVETGVYSFPDGRKTFVLYLETLDGFALYYEFTNPPVNDPTCIGSPYFTYSGHSIIGEYALAVGPTSAVCSSDPPPYLRRLAPEVQFNEGGLGVDIDVYATEDGHTAIHICEETPAPLAIAYDWKSYGPAPN